MDKNRQLQAVPKDLNRPNGLAFSPGEKTLYAANSDEKNRFCMRCDVVANGSDCGGAAAGL